MRLLIVHHEAEIGEALAGMVRDHTEDEAHVLRAAVAVDDWLEVHRSCDLLLVQLAGEGIDGLALRETLQAKFPGLRTLFLPGYRASDRRIEVAKTHVFPEPIDGAGLLEAVAATETAGDCPQRWDVIDFVQMCALGKQTGVLRCGEVTTAALFIQAGRIVHAEMGTTRGEDAVTEVVALGETEIHWQGNVVAGETSIDSEWDAVLQRAITRVEERKTTSIVPFTPPHESAVAPVLKPLRAAPKPAKSVDGMGLLTGTDVGPYHVRRKLGEGAWGEVYEAEQTTMARPVALKIMASTLQPFSQKAEQFVADASAKANVHHSSVVAVYEAGEWNGSLFYARELVLGETLSEMEDAGHALDEKLALQIVRAVAEAAAYLRQKGIRYRPLDSARIYIAAGGYPRLANPAIAQDGLKPAPAQGEITSLSRALLPLVSPSGALGGRVLDLLGKMQMDGSGGVRSWSALLKLVTTIEGLPGFGNTFKLNAEEEAAIRAVDDVKRRRRRGLFWSLVALGALCSGSR